jgi:hypothetical protein
MLPESAQAGEASAMSTRGTRAAARARIMARAPRAARGRERSRCCFGGIAESCIAIGEPKDGEAEGDDEGERCGEEEVLHGSRQSMTWMNASGAKRLTSVRQACALGTVWNFTKLAASVVGAKAGLRCWLRRGLGWGAAK